MKLNIEIANSKLARIIQTPKRVKILVGGRGSTKSTFIADYVLACMSSGQLWCCAREFQNSIDESVHRLLLDEIERIDFAGFTHDNSGIQHVTGGRCFYKGLARNPTSLKSMLSGVSGLWIEEGESVSEKTLRALTASLRLTAKDAEKKLAGEYVKPPEIIITMNRGSRLDAIANKYLKRAEPELARSGIYEDDELLVIEINYDEIPKDWWEASGLEVERASDEANMSTAYYRHKWHGDYLESVDNPLILPEWFDAAIDSHKKLNIEPLGAVVTAHDPADGGRDPAAYAARKGIYFFDFRELAEKDGNEACRAATRLADNHRANLFVWDADGLGALLREQIKRELHNIESRPFRGGGAVENKGQLYSGYLSVGKGERALTNGDTFYNKRAQNYVKLAQRFENTYRAVVKGEYIDPDQLISLNGDCEYIDKLRSEICRVSRKIGTGKIQLLSKADMLSAGIASPNIADCLAMAMEEPERIINKVQNIEFEGWI